MKFTVLIETDEGETLSVEHSIDKEIKTLNHIEDAVEKFKNEALSGIESKLLAHCCDKSEGEKKEKEREA